jgi:hypothetical protein
VVAASSMALAVGCFRDRLAVVLGCVRVSAALLRA